MPTLSDPSIWLRELFLRVGLSIGMASFLSTVALLLIVLFLSWLSNLIARVIIENVVTQIVKRTKSQWDDIFLEQKVFTGLSHLAPALVIWFMAGWALKEYPTWLNFVQKLTYIYMVAVGTFVIFAFIDAWHEIYKTLPLSRHRHIKGYVQLVKIFIFSITFLILFSVIFKKDLTKIVTGLGAMAAVLILVFKDTLLGLVASIQLSADDMLKVGDWITIPGRNVDGVVADITLNTVKIRNFDKTVITVPTYSLVNESFQNWKEMEGSGTRQIKRAILIDMKSIRFIDSQMREKFLKVDHLKTYLASVEKKAGPGTTALSENKTPFFNLALATNLGLFRQYAEAYMKQHPLIDNAQIVMARHRVSDGNGLPLQVYLFTKDHRTIPYENTQSEIFEHLLAILNEFGLKVFQQPTGYDILASNSSIKN